MTKLFLVLSLCFLSFQRYTKDWFFISYLGMRTRFWANCCVILEKLLACKLLSLGYFSDGKRRFTTKDIWAHSAHGFVMWLICHVHVTYDCIPHDFLIAKLEANGLEKQLTKIGFGLFDWWDVVCGIPQGSIPILCCLTLLQTQCFALSQNLIYVIFLIIIQ